MRHIKKICKLIIFLVLLGIIIRQLSIFLVGDVWNTVEPICTILGVVMVLIELKESRDLSEGSFVAGLSDSFNNNEAIQRIYKKLELRKQITDDETVDIVLYLTYFETIYVLLKKKSIDISLIDDLFAYRFRLALNDPVFRRISLVKYDYAYVNIYRLEKIWCNYKKADSILEAHNPNYSIILRGNKMRKNDIFVKLATIENADEIYSVMKRVYDRLENKTLYVCDDIDYVKSQISSEGFAVIACNKVNEIVGCFIFRYPDMQEDNLGRDINLDDSKLKQVVHMESAVVLPEYRGQSLQSKMLKYAEELIDKDKYKFFMATVSPENPASYTTFEKNGYKLMLTKEKYGGLMRRVYLKEV